MAGYYKIYYKNPYVHTIGDSLLKMATLTIQLTTDMTVCPAWGCTGYLTCHVVSNQASYCEVQCEYQEHAYEDGLMHFMAYEIKYEPE